MNYAPVARPDLGGLYPFVFAEIRRDGDVHIGYDAVGWDLDLFWHLDDHVGLADGPAFDELGRGGQVSGVAFRSSLVNPRSNCIDFFLRQVPVIQEMAVFRSGKPGWHRSALDFFLDRSRPGPGVAIADERHWCYFAFPVALNAVLIENRSDVPVESDSGARWSAG